MFNNGITNHYNKWHGANTALLKLNLNDKYSLYYGDFGIIWGVWKPYNIATTLGKEISLLDILTTQYHDHPLIQKAMEEFGVNKELGMLTRLDNSTGGMVWFAHTHEIKSLWLQDQLEGKINKIYEADVVGRIKEAIIINTPIMHHRYDDTKMIVIKNISDINKGRGKIHQVSTQIIPGKISGNNTHIQSIIHQGCRHQIRIHCATYGNPIIGESVYHTQQTDNFLHLMSVGLDRDQLDTSIVIEYQQYYNLIGQK